MNVNLYLNSPQHFINDLHVPTGAGPKRFGSVMAEFQRDRFTLLAPSLLSLVKGEMPLNRRFWIEATKGASKDSDLACCLLWMLFAARQPIRAQIGAGDAKQADEVRLILRTLLRIDAPLNKMLAGLIEVQAEKVINIRTESVAEILTTDNLGSHGSRPDFVLINELSHISNKEFAETLMDNADKIPRGIVVIATNSGFIPSWQAEWKALAVESPRWVVHQYNQPAPWISAEDLADSRKRNSLARFRRLWWGEWVTGGGGDALDAEAIERAITLAGPSLPELGWAVVAGLDLGLVRDHSALCVLAKHVGHFQEADAELVEPVSTLRAAMLDLDLIDDEQLDENLPKGIEVEGTGRVKLLHTSRWKPGNGQNATQTQHGGKVEIAEIESAILALHSRYSFTLRYDPHQCEFLAQRLRAAGVDAIPCEFTGPNLRIMAQEVLTNFAESKVDLYPEESLLKDLHALRAEEKSYGVRLTSPRGPDGHGDLATAFAIAMLGCRTVNISGPTVSGELTCWP